MSQEESPNIPRPPVEAVPSFPAPPFSAPAVEAASPAVASSDSATSEVELRKPSGQARAGSISFQEPGITVPRPPTLAESRARYQAEQAEQQRSAEEVVAKEKRKRSRKLIGGIAVVGIVGVVALAYISSPGQQCYDESTREVVSDSYCTNSYHSNDGVYVYHGGGWFGPLIYGGMLGSFGRGPSSGGSPSSESGRSSDGGNSKQSPSDHGGVQRGGINPGGGGSSSS